MADETTSDAGGGEAKAKKRLPIGLILAGLNTLAVLGVVGLLVYTKLLYKRPPITESAEREKIQAESEKAMKAPTNEKFLVKLDPLQATLKPSQIGAQVQGGPPVQLKPHYLTVTLAFEINDSSRETALREQLPKFLDQLLRSLGNTTVEELATVQGRFILRSKIIGLMNDLVKKSPADPPLVTNVYFSDFVAQ